MSQPPDIADQAAYRRRVAGATVPFSLAYRTQLDRLGASPNNPARIRNTAFVFPHVRAMALAAFLDRPQLLVPANPNRVALLISGILTHGIGNDFEAYYSFGFPSKGVSGAGAFTYGLPLPGYNLQNVFDLPSFLAQQAPRNGTVSTDDLYITFALAGALSNSSSASVVAYEGVLAVEANELAAA